MELKFQSDEVLEEVKIIKNNVFTDQRGKFIKYYFSEINQKLKFNIDEAYYSVNNQGVIRGIHYQSNEEPLEKIVTCIDGEILDLIIDMRPDSKEYGKFTSVKLSGKNNLSVYVPKGFGHGFSVLSKTATVQYLQSGNYAPQYELGLNPLSLDFNWCVENPIISEKDLKLPNINT